MPASLLAVGSMVPFEATTTLACTLPSQTGSPPGQADEATFTCTVKVLVLEPVAATSPVELVQVNPPVAAAQPAPEAKLTSLGSVPVTVKPPRLSDRPLLVTVTE